MRTAMQKIRRDLWQYKARTLLIIMSIAVGVMAVGMITTSNYLLTTRMKDSHISSNPSHAWLYIRGSVDDAAIRSLARTEGVAQMEGFAEIGIRWKANLEDEWQDASIIMLADYENQLFDQLTLLDGGWPTDISVGVEFNHIAGFGAPGLGETVYFEVNDRPRSMVVGGTVRDPFHFPPPFDTSTAFYVTQDVLLRLRGFTGYDTIRFTIDNYSEENVQAIADDIDEKLQNQGSGVNFVQVLNPDEHFLQEIMDGVNIVLSVMAVASLGLSTVLVINTMTALLAQQVAQIGIMKAVGGVRQQIAQLYLAGVVIYGLLSLAVAVPLGAVGGDLLSRWILTILNVPTASFEILPQVFGLQIIIGLLTPLLAALYPILRAVAIAVANALNQHGLGTGQYGAGWLDNILARIHGMPRLLILSLRNTFRRPGRVLLTLLTLTFAGGIFMMVLSAQFSFNSTIDKIFKGFGFEVMVGFEQLQRIEEIIPLIEARPNVELAEMWAFMGGEARVPGAIGPGSLHDIFPRGIPRDSQLFSPELVAGRLLLPDDGRAILLNQKLAGRMGVSVGDQIILDLGIGKESTWTIVGLVFDLGGRDQDTAFVYIDMLNRVINRTGQATVAEVRATEDTLAMQKIVEKDLLQYFESQGVGISFTDTAQENKAQANSQFNILTTILMVMTVLMGVVGSIGLSGTLSINIIERRREIGVMRAVGASTRDVVLVFSGEGLMLGLISWTLAVPFSLALGPLFVTAIGQAIDFPAVYSPAVNGIWIWLLLVTILSLGASWLPSRRATKISVNESLAYE